MGWCLVPLYSGTRKYSGKYWQLTVHLLVPGLTGRCLQDPVLDRLRGSGVRYYNQNHTLLPALSAGVSAQLGLLVRICFAAKILQTSFTVQILANPNIFCHNLL